MVDEVTDSAENKVSSDALDRARLARERRDAEQKKRLDELRAHAAAAQAQREKRDEDRRRRQAEQRARDDDRRVQVEERKRAIWEASVSRREALIQREREREERLERSRASRSGSRSAFAFGSSTPRLLEPVDTTGFFWAARRAASTTNVMYASAPLTRGTSALQLDLSDGDHTKDETDRSPQPMWSSVARRRTDLVPTLPLSRAPGRAYSMTRLDRLSPRPLHAHSPSMLHLNRTKHEARSGDSTPVSRPGSALSSANTSVVRRNVPTPRRPRPNSIAGTGVNTPKGGILDPSGQSLASTPCVSRDASSGNFSSEKKPTRKTRPLSAHVNTPKFMTLSTTPSDGKPPLHRKPKLPKEHDKSSRSNKSKSVSPGRSTHSPTPVATKENSEHKDVHAKRSTSSDKRQVCPTEVTQKLEALQIQNEDLEQVSHKVIETVTIEKREVNEAKPNENISVVNNKPEIVHAQEKKEKIEEKREKADEKKENGEESEMTASMYARRITTEEEAKAALAERRRKAREEFERQAEIERLRQEQEAKLAAEALALQQERERKEEEEAQELANRRRREDEEKLRKAIEAQQQLEREEAERKAREEADRIAKMKEEEEKRRIAEEENRLKRLEAEKEERERLLRKQRVEAIMARTRLKKAEEDKKQQEKPQPSSENQNDNSKEVSPSSEQNNKQKENGNTADLLGINSDNSVDLNGKSTSSELSSESNKTMNNGNFEDLLGLSDTNNATDKPTEAKIIEKEDSNKTESNGTHNVGHITAGFIQTEKMAEEINQQKLTNAFEDDFTSHNGHSNINHPLMQNAI